MIGPFCYKDLATDEEYKDYLKKRNKIFIALIFVGILTFLCLAFFYHMLLDYSRGFLAGMGSGLIVGGIVLFYKNTNILKNPQKIREERIKISDERNRMICDHASKMALIGIIVEIYIIMIISLITRTDTYRICTLIIGTFLVFYAMDITFILINFNQFTL